MVTISKPLSAAQVCLYHEEEFQNASANYYTEGDRIVGQWHGQLAATWGLSGDVDQAQFRLLADGRHPTTWEQLVRHQTPRTSTNHRGQTVTTMDHRAAWDATFSAPKSISLTALVGGDWRVREAHEASVDVALDELERYVQARLGGTLVREATGKWVAARYEHDSARPVDGYVAPQLHTHVVFFNLTQTEDGDIKPLQPRELYRTQQYSTAIYRSELATRLTALGYEVTRGKSDEPEIAGYSHDYLEASSPRRQQIEAYLTQVHQSGAAAAQIAALHTREAKLDRSREDVQRQHRTMAQAIGNQPARVVAAAEEGAHRVERAPARTTAYAAVSFAKDRNFEREAISDERLLLRDALVRSMSDQTIVEITREFERRVEAGEFLTVEQTAGVPGRAFTTPEIIALERDTIRLMRAGQGSREGLMSEEIRRDTASAAPHLSHSQRAAVDQILTAHDQIMALEGIAGAGKTTALVVIRDAVERQGYHVEGFAPTSRAAQRLREAGILATTLQHHLARGDGLPDGRTRFYVLDESSLASTRQMHDFLRRLRTDDRVLLVGDVRQHQAVDAGRPYQQLQDAGIQIARLDQIVRQQDPSLRAVVEQLARGDVRRAMHELETKGRLHEVSDRRERFQAIAHEYLKEPNRTLVVSPDNRSRLELNVIVHDARQQVGQVDPQGYHMPVLVPRPGVSGADRQWAARYERGDILRYTKGSQTLGLGAGTYAQVQDVNPFDNRVTVKTDDGRRVSYDPRRLQGVTLYREAERAFARGDRVQLTAPDRSRHLANRELGTIEHVERGAGLRVRLDSGRTVSFEPGKRHHLDYGYVVTSHSSQGQTADRVLVHVETDRADEQLVNRRLAYVALSRGRVDAQLFTDDLPKLTITLDREISHHSALERSPVPSASRRVERGQGLAQE